MNTLVQQFISDVEANPANYSEAVRLSVSRHLTDMEGMELYEFDEAAAERAIKFVRLCRHTKGEWKGRPFDIQPWQAFILWVLFGWLRKDDGSRRFRKAYVKVPRKNGKTEFVAAIGIYTAFFDGEPAAEVFVAATKKEQARICFDAMKRMCRRLRVDSERAKKEITVYMHSIFNVKSESTIKALGADSNTEDGLSPNTGIIDEYHAHRTDEMVKVIETGMGARRNPLLFIITTAGFNKESPCYNLERVCFDILRGHKEDDTMFSLMFGIDEDDDWRDEKTWQKANPNLGVSVTWNYMRSQYTKAINEGLTAETEFRTKNLNEWTTVSKTWISDQVWSAFASPVSATDLEGRICVGGLDLSSSRDTTAFCLLFPPMEEGEQFKVLWWYWCPKDEAEEKNKNGLPYLEWERDGYLTCTEGNVIDQKWIEATIRDCCERFQVHSIAYDRYNSDAVVVNLIESEISMEKFGQSTVYMNAPTVALERMILKGEINHGNNPVSNWQIRNVEIITDSSGNIKITKGGSLKGGGERYKVDGIIALVMALGQYLTKKDELSIPWNDGSDIAFL